MCARRLCDPLPNFFGYFLIFATSASALGQQGQNVYAGRGQDFPAAIPMPATRRFLPFCFFRNGTGRPTDTRPTLYVFCSERGQRRNRPIVRHCEQNPNAGVSHVAKVRRYQTSENTISDTCGCWSRQRRQQTARNA